MLTSGSKLGAYEILGLVGSGGMGEVYRARDTRLDRTVALKVMKPGALHNGTERLAREARAISSLNHPNVCAIYDIGSESGSDYLVLEYLEGETLAKRLLRGALPLDEAQRYAIERLEGLDAAHRKGLVHRDLKPGNIMLSKSGAKILDFGLAKLSARNVHSGSTPTGEALTREGMIVGTLQYMSPEHLRGIEADTRTDIFAFGLILYEMIKGQPAFPATTEGGLIDAILNHKPAPVKTLPELMHVIDTCLEKDSEKRWQSAADIARHLVWISQKRQNSSEPSSGNSNIRRNVFTGVAIILVAVLGAYIGLRFGDRQARPLSRFSIELPPGSQINDLGINHVAISPDGRDVVFSTSITTGRIYRRSAANFEVAAIEGTEGGFSPFFSPDGRWIAFFTENYLKKVPAAGGAPVTICVTALSSGGSWSGDDRIVFTQSSNGLRLVSANGGVPAKLTTPDLARGERNHLSPRFLPGGKHVLFSIQRGDSHDDAELVALDLNTKTLKPVLTGAIAAEFVAPATLFYVTRGSIWSIMFDEHSLDTRGNSVLVQKEIAVGFRGDSQFAVSKDGDIAYLPGGPDVGKRNLVWVDRSGVKSPINATPNYYWWPRLSPKETAFIVQIEGPTTDLWLYDLMRGTLTRWTSEVNSWVGVWSPDSREIVFNTSATPDLSGLLRTADVAGSIYRKSVAGDMGARLISGSFLLAPESWCEPHSVIAMNAVSPDTNRDIAFVSLNGDRSPKFPIQTRFNEGAPHFSPDCKWLAYNSDESGTTEVYVRPYPGMEPKIQISVGGGSEPAWRHDGSELFYRSDGRMFAVPIRADAELHPSKPVPLFEDEYIRTSLGTSYDVSRDGRRFLMIEAVQPISTIRVILGWAAP